jgi:hypothetical protein
MNTWNRQPESYQQTVYHNTVAPVKRQIQQAESPMLAMVISVEAAPLDNAVLLDYSTTEVVLEELEVGSTDPNVPTDNSCTDIKLYLGMPHGSADYKVDGDDSDESNAIPTIIQ